MKTSAKLVALIIVSVFIFCGAAMAADRGDFSTKPVTNEGKKWRIGYYEGGEYYDYKGVFVATLKGMMNLGWIEHAEIPVDKGEQTDTIWKWLATHAKSDYVEFVADAHYSAKWDAKLRKQMVEGIIKRLNEQKDIDLMIAIGTWAGKDLANNRHHTPTVVLTASDAVGAGIIKSTEDSGYDHVQAHVDPSRYERQIRIFHDIVGFKTLGVAYELSLIHI